MSSMKGYRYSQDVIDAAVAAYGKRSMSNVARSLGVSTGAVSHWWSAAKRDGRIEPLFGRFDGVKARLLHEENASASPAEQPIKLPQAKPLSPSHIDALNAVARAGGQGLSGDEIRAAMGVFGGKYAVDNFLWRARKLGYRIVTVRVGRKGPTNIHRYVLVEGNPAPETAPTASSVRAVARKISGDLGLGSTPGTVISVPYLSFLDAAAGQAQSGGVR